MSNSKKILLQVTGSIAAFKAVALCSQLVQLGHEVEVIVSEGAKNFVGVASFEGFTRRKVHDGLYTEGTMMAHIDLERWADLILIYPASANTIAKLSNGEADSLISALFLAHEFKKPYFIAPAMNQAMFHHPSMKNHLEKLQGYGVTILMPEDGFLACGEVGAGRLIEPDEIISIIQKPNLNQKKILITSGGTTEPIDQVRSITNFSTGETGYRIAEKLIKEGHEVHLIQSKNSNFHLRQDETNYVTTVEFEEKLKSKLQKNDYDYFIHAAAVADFKVENQTLQKIKSDSPITLNLTPNKKIISHIRTWSKNNALKMISFKLTANSEMKLEAYDSEWIIHNELKNVHSDQHIGTIYNKDRIPQLKFNTKTELTQLVQNIIEGKIT